MHQASFSIHKNGAPNTSSVRPFSSFINNYLYMCLQFAFRHNLSTFFYAKIFVVS